MELASNKLQEVAQHSLASEAAVFRAAVVASTGHAHHLSRITVNPGFHHFFVIEDLGHQGEDGCGQSWVEEDLGKGQTRLHHCQRN